MRAVLVLGVLWILGCRSKSPEASDAEFAGDAAHPLDVPPSMPACPAGRIFVYEQGCDRPAGHCVNEVDGGGYPWPQFCLCDGTTVSDATGVCPVEPPPSDAGSDAGPAEGVCCPITGIEGCLGVNAYVGGWARFMVACERASWMNVAPRRLGTDAHGCAVLEENRAAPRCNLMALDAGSDVPPGAVYCTDSDGTRIVDPRTDPRNCGGCGRRCCGLFCVGGRCGADGAGRTACPLSAAEEEALGCFGPLPFDLLNDPNHCGACDRHCASGEVCERAACVAPDAGAAPLDAASDGG